MNGPFRLVCVFFTTCPVGEQDVCPTLVNFCNILLFELAKLLLLKKGVTIILLCPDRIPIQLAHCEYLHCVEMVRKPHFFFLIDSALK